MRINWKLRLKNKTALFALVSTVVTLIYQVLGVAGVVAPVGEDMVIKGAGLILNALVMLGVLVDPTTAGIDDSTRALTYKEPREEM